MTDESDKTDIPRDNGERPPIARVGKNTRLGAIGTGSGYSGQEYDSNDQQRWRDEQDRLAVAHDGEVTGTGIGAGGGNPGEDFDGDSASGDGSQSAGQDVPRATK